MKRPLMAGCLAVLLTMSAHALGPVIKSPQKSISTSGQFVVYCDDLSMRLEVTGYVEDVKNHVLSILGLKDAWQVPLVLTILPQRAADPDRPISEVRLYENETGFAEELNITITDHPQDAHFQEQLIRAILLEIAYRGTGLIKAGKPYQEPPAWLVQGIAWFLQTRDSGGDADIFKTIINVNKLPALRSFLSENPANYDPVSLAVYRAYAMSLLEVLMDTNGGRRPAWPLRPRPAQDRWRSPHRSAPGLPQPRHHRVDHGKMVDAQHGQALGLRPLPGPEPGGNRATP
ncbi:MAG: hypothetical protein QM796_22460 [Chthoniobacteraceae bacterium]